MGLVHALVFLITSEILILVVDQSAHKTLIATDLKLALTKSVETLAQEFVATMLSVMLSTIRLAASVFQDIPEILFLGVENRLKVMIKNKNPSFSIHI